MEQKNISKNEHSLNIKAGLAVLKTMYGLSIDEYDYLDIAVDTLSNIKYFGTTEYIMYPVVDRDGKILLPCNVNTIDAVTSSHMGEKVFGTRVLFDMEGIINTDTYYRSERIRTGLGRAWEPGIGGLEGTGYISYHVNGKHIQVDKKNAGQKIAVAYSGITSDLDGYPIITRKQANAIAAVVARVISLKGANRGDKGMASMVEFYTGRAGVLVQAASIPEYITDNELDEVFDRLTTFNRKTVNRPSKYGR